MLAHTSTDTHAFPQHLQPILISCLSLAASALVVTDIFHCLNEEARVSTIRKAHGIACFFSLVGVLGYHLYVKSIEAWCVSFPSLEFWVFTCMLRPLRLGVSLFPRWSSGFSLVHYVR
ncbi:uncharacterized protein F5147DRAFT_382650 [Suillus discolor]|uniref:Uncharacterized protein n=1 Tax=Suillus discolor TaxID=1912936 RepID=A0A9P7JY82_9AGAM|nr:uncharacterized protein F5147DRAFT_382650 [Suillus discolor]KAG2115856.1 hypothetical protein F5147DRAFT_382650 [Suillus discolor]